MTESGRVRIRKTRNKPVKSCRFCRQRKLKCDQKRPICSSCTSRNLTICEYTVSETNLKIKSHSITRDPLDVQQSHLISKVSTLERQVEEITRRSPAGNSSTNISALQYKNDPLFRPTTVQPEPETASNTPPHKDQSVFQNDDTHLLNPLCDYYYLQCKPSGRRILYGATSMRASLSRRKFGFGEKYDQLWGKIKLERNKWKQLNQRSSLQELKYLEQPNDTVFKSLLDRLCFELPPYNKCIEIINLFFDNKFQDLSLVNSTLDKNKVIIDFYTCFIPDTENTLPNGDRKIKKLLAGDKRNYYKVAVIVQIIVLRYYYQNSPDSVNIFSLYLLGGASAKVFFMERLQFMLLRCYYIRNYMADCDDSNIITLVSNLVSTAITAGLDRDINHVYKDQETIVGNLRSLKNMWLLIQFLDLESALQTGRDLQLPSTDLDYQNDNTIFDGDPKLNKLMKVTKLGRKILKCVNARMGTPKFQGLVDHMLEFMEFELPDISFFTDPERLKQVDLNDIRIVALCLDIILCLSKLKFRMNENLEPKLRNASIHICLLSLHVFAAATERFFQLDQEYFPDMYNESTSNLTPHFIQSIGLTGGLLPRITYIFCSIMYFRLTQFMINDFVFINQLPYEWEPRKLRPPKEEIPIACALDIHKKICDKWLRPNDSIKRKIMGNSYHFVIANAIQRTFRKVLDKCIEYRKHTEEIWISQLGNDSYGIDPPIKSLPNLLTSELTTSDISSRGSYPNSMHTASQNMNNGETHPNPQLNVATNGQNNNKQNYNEDERTPVSTVDSLNINTEPGMTSIPSTHDAGVVNTTEEKESEMLQQITDEFWSSYNTGWEEVVNNTNAYDFFHNC